MFQTLRKQTFALVMLAVASLCFGSCDGQAQMAGPDHRYVLRADLEEIWSSHAEGKSDEEILDWTMAALVQRLESLGIQTHDISHDGTDLITLETSGVRSDEALARILGLEAAQVDFLLEDMSALPQDTMSGTAPAGTEILPMAQEEGSQIAVRLAGGISGRRIMGAYASSDAMTNEPAVMIEFDPQGTAQLAELTQSHIGERLAVVLDGAVLTAPVIREPVTAGRLMVAGGFTEESANALAISLASGALPRPFVIVEEGPIE